MELDISIRFRICELSEKFIYKRVIDYSAIFLCFWWSDFTQYVLHTYIYTSRSSRRLFFEMICENQISHKTSN